jgi:hypothetical protein
MDFPKFDLSKPPHPEMIDLFVPFIPGLFFEISVLAADRGIFTATRSFALGPYSQAALFLFVAYFCGLVAVIINNLLLRFMVGSYEVVHIFVVRSLHNFETRVLHEPLSDSSQREKTRYRIAAWLQRRRSTKEDRFRAASRVWGASATRLLLSRYGIDSMEEQFTSTEWSAWRAILGEPTDREIRGSSLVRALSAAGWAGLVARHIAWPLRLVHYRSFCILLIICATLYSLLIAYYWMDPIEASIARTMMVLRRIPEPRINESEQSEKEK